MVADFTTFDYIIVGGGTAGSTLASLLSKSRNAPSVLVLEAGADLTQHPLTQAPLACFVAANTDIDWAYQSAPQGRLDNRSVYIPAGRGLGGGTATNYGTWTCGPAYDYDRWGALVGDQRWSYAGLLPLFTRLEESLSPSSIVQSSPLRKFPLRQRMLQAWLDLGLEQVSTADSGHPVGVGELVETFRDGKRQMAHVVFDLNKTTVLTNAVVQRVLLEDRGGKVSAVGVELADGRQFKCNKEVIISAGAYRTPQVLMLSGIGSAKTLEQYGIPVIVESPEVGQNLHDHLLFALAYRLRKEWHGHSLPGPNGSWSDPAYQFGLPGEWVITENIPSDRLKEAVRQDELEDHTHTQYYREYTESLLSPSAAHLETISLYAPVPVAGQPERPINGTLIGSPIGLFAPTSRGTVTLASKSALDPPSIDPRYLATEVDRVSMRYAVRRALKAYLGSMSEVVEAEVPGPGANELTLESTDEEIDARVRSEVGVFYHGSGTASMGSVVDTQLRVKGVEGLRVADTSVLPMPIGAHTQAIAYAIGAQAADLLVGGI